MVQTYRWLWRELCAYEPAAAGGYKAKLCSCCGRTGCSWLLHRV